MSITNVKRLRIVAVPLRILWAFLPTSPVWAEDPGWTVLMEEGAITVDTTLEDSTNTTLSHTSHHSMDRKYPHLIAEETSQIFFNGTYLLFNKKEQK